MCFTKSLEEKSLCFVIFIGLGVGSMKLVVLLLLLLKFYHHAQYMFG